MTEHTLDMTKYKTWGTVQFRERGDVRISPEHLIADVEQWIKDTNLGILFMEKEVDGFGKLWQPLVSFPDRESKVLFKMAFDVP